ncbi:MAG TPA: recombinase family protein [Brumimicrobium sp.]|nr:recombinase family protein [Brumimicrobium sp.]
MNSYFFYSRISTSTQSANRQIENFKTHEGYNSSKLFIDKIQGNIPFMQRPEASKLFDSVTSLNKKVVVIVDSIDRLGRNLLDVLKTIELFTENGISLKSIKEGFTTLLDNGKENPTAKLVISVMGSIAEMERNRIKERTTEGIAIAKAKGKYQGRKFGSVQTTEKMLQRHADIVKKLEKGLTIREIAQITGKSTATVQKVKNVIN